MAGIAKLISLIFPPVTIVAGNVGNVLALLTLFFSSSLRQRPLSMVLISLSFCDILTLNTGYLVGWIQELQNYGNIHPDKGLI